jgi:hypothetical protein
MQTQLLNLFRAHATADMAVAPASLPSGSWAVPVDCRAIVAAGDYSAISGLGRDVVGIDAGGFGGYVSPALNALMIAHSEPGRQEGFPGTCAIHAGPVNEGVFFVVSTGTRWRGESSLDGTPAARLEVAGVEEVWVQSFTTRTFVDVFDGPNWLNFQAPAGMDVGKVAKQLITALNATATP